ncbi:hypothetical protein [Yoonia sp. SDW83-1]|uniref:hypothetical protein n=1 Tax=Yoonia sp. SDW83-1 TaxID=3366945 RepID=UPI00398C7E57
MIWRGIISALGILALLTVSLGHQPPDPGKQAQAAAYILAGGSFSDLCSENGDPTAGHTPGCEACTISATCALPDASGQPMHVSLPRTIAWINRHVVETTTRMNPDAPARAPPFV